MSVAAVTKADDLSLPTIVPDRTARKKQGGDAQHSADMLCCAARLRYTRIDMPVDHATETRDMETDRVVIPGIVKEGIVVPQNDTPLPDGAHVEIVIGPADITGELQAEFAAWEQASDEAWSMIDEWEKEEQ